MGGGGKKDWRGGWMGVDEGDGSGNGGVGYNFPSQKNEQSIAGSLNPASGVRVIQESSQLDQ